MMLKHKLNLQRALFRYGVAGLALAGAAGLLLVYRAHANLTTVSLVFVVVVTAAAMIFGSGPALCNSVLGLLILNYFFIPPTYTWSIRDPENWIAFTAFAVTAVMVGQLSSRAKQTATQAETRRVEIERLYQELRKAFAEASEAEALRNSERLKSALLEAVTHDLRTPLTAIKASATSLLETGAEAELTEDARRDLLQVIDEEADRLDRFVESMMELAKIEAGQLSLKRAPVSALEIANAALDRCGASLDGFPVEVAIAEDLPKLQVDAASVAAVLVQLLDNATKYSKPGSPIMLSATRCAAGMIELAVVDRGAGIAEEHREKIFEKFYRHPRVRSRGFGLGLAIARGIVEAHGGEIWVESNPEGGSRFKFTVAAQASTG
jgi:K+-sensing histidine kinase KdpD